MVVGESEEGTHEELAGHYGEKGCCKKPSLFIEKLSAYEVHRYYYQSAKYGREIGACCFYDALGWGACAEEPYEETENQVIERRGDNFLPVWVQCERIEADSVREMVDEVFHHTHVVP